MKQKKFSYKKKKFYKKISSQSQAAKTKEENIHKENILNYDDNFLDDFERRLN